MYQHRGTGRSVPFATSHMIGRENKRTNNKAMLLDRKNSGAAGYQGPVKIDHRRGAGLLKGKGYIPIDMRLPLPPTPGQDKIVKGNKGESVCLLSIFVAFSCFLLHTLGGVCFSLPLAGSVETSEIFAFGFTPPIKKLLQSIILSHCNISVYFLGLHRNGSWHAPV